MINEKNSQTDAIEELVAIAKNDQSLWQLFKDREIEFEQRYAAARDQGKWLDSPDVELPPSAKPVFYEIINSFMQDKADKYKDIMHPNLGMAIRKEIRIELGLPV